MQWTATKVSSACRPATSPQPAPNQAVCYFSRVLEAEERPGLPAICWHTMLREGNSPSGHHNNTSTELLAGQPTQLDMGLRRLDRNRNRLDKDNNRKATRSRKERRDMGRRNKSQSHIRHRNHLDSRRRSHHESLRHRGSCRHDRQRLPPQRGRMQQGKNPKLSRQIFALHDPFERSLPRPSYDHQSPPPKLNGL